MTPPILAWSSRHPATPEHLDALRAYRVVACPVRHTSVKEAWLDIILACGRCAPDVVMLVTDHHIYTPLVRHIARCVPATAIIRPIMWKPALAGDSEWTWTGRWHQLVIVQKRSGMIGTDRVAWTPQEGVGR